MQAGLFITNSHHALIIQFVNDSSIHVQEMSVVLFPIYSPANIRINIYVVEPINRMTSMNT